MKVIVKPRCCGKTTLLIKTAAKNQMPILCGNLAQKEIYRTRAIELGLPIPQLFTVDDLINSRARGLCYKHILVDEADYVLEQFIRQTSYFQPLIATMTLEEGEK